MFLKGFLSHSVREMAPLSCSYHVNFMSWVALTFISGSGLSESARGNLLVSGTDSFSSDVEDKRIRTKKEYHSPLFQGS